MQVERTAQLERALREVQQAVESVQTQLPPLVQGQLQEALPRVQVHHRGAAVGVLVLARLDTLHLRACVA